MDKSLVENGIYANSMVQIRLANIVVKIKPTGISKDGTAFVGQFHVQTSPLASLRNLSDALIKSEHLLFSRDKLSFTLVENNGHIRDLNDDSVQSMALREIGFYDNCVLAVRLN